MRKRPFHFSYQGWLFQTFTLEVNVSSSCVWQTRRKFQKQRSWRQQRGKVSLIRSCRSVFSDEALASVKMLQTRIRLEPAVVRFQLSREEVKLCLFITTLSEGLHPILFFLESPKVVHEFVFCGLLPQMCDTCGVKSFKPNISHSRPLLLKNTSIIIQRKELDTTGSRMEAKLKWNWSIKSVYRNDENSNGSPGVWLEKTLIHKRLFGLWVGFLFVCLLVKRESSSDLTLLYFGPLNYSAHTFPLPFSLCLSFFPPPPLSDNLLPIRWPTCSGEIISLMEQNLWL